MQLRRIIGGVIVGLSWLASLPTFAAGPLDLVPETVSTVIRFKNPEQTIVKVGNYANAGVPGTGFLIQGQAPALGVLISNPTLGGVDLKQDWIVAVFLQKNAEPSVVFIVPSTDKDALKEAVGSNFSFVTSDNWVAYSEDSAATELIQQCKSGKAKSISSKLDKRVSDVLDDSELSAYVNLTRLREIYSEEFENADKKLVDGIEGLKALTAGTATPGFSMDAIWDMYANLGKSLLQGARDANSFTVGIKVSAENFMIEELFLANKDTATDKFLQRHQPDELRVLNKLPQDRQGYFAVHGDTQGMVSWAMELSASMFGNNPELKEKLAKFTKDAQSVKIGAIGGTFGLNAPGPEGVMSAIMVSEVTPAEKWRQISREISAGYKLDLPGVKQEITVKQDAEKVGDVTVDLITIKQEVDENADPLQIQKQLMEVMYGKNGMVQRMAAMKTTFIQTIGGGSEQMKLAVETAQKSEGSKSVESALTKSRSRQMAKANVVGMIDLPNFVLKAAIVAGEVAGKGDVPPLPIPLPTKQFQALKIEPTFVTFGISTEPQGLRMRTDVPSATIAGFFKIYQAFQAANRPKPNGR